MVAVGGAPTEIAIFFYGLHRLSRLSFLVNLSQKIMNFINRERESLKELYLNTFTEHRICVVYYTKKIESGADYLDRLFFRMEMISIQ